MVEEILLVPNIIKNNVIKKVRKKNPLLNLKFMSLEEFAKKMTFDYDEETIYALMEKYNIKVDTALVYLKNLYYISDKIDNDKMTKLKEIKKYLEENNLLIKDKHFKDYVQNKKIYIYGYDYINKYYLSILNGLGYQVYEEEKNRYEVQEIMRADSKEEEVLFVATTICNLLDKGISLSNIKLIAPSEYDYTLKRIFKIHNIPLSNNKNSIYSIPLVKELLNSLSNPEDTLNKINNKSSELYAKIINILNKYSFASNKEKVRELIERDLKNTYLASNNGIVVTTLDDIFSDEDYVFLLGFNKENIPVIVKDEDYFSDLEKEKLNLATSNTLNIETRKSTISKIKAIKNLTITYKLYGDAPQMRSDLIEDVTITPISNDDYKYSNLMNKIELAKKLDNLLKYNINDNNLGLLYSNYQDLPYLKYDNAYHQIDKEDLYKYLDNKLTLSYSSLDIYHKCKFRYYLSSILKINTSSDDFASIIGSVCHYVLSKIDEEDFDIDVYYAKFLEDARTLTAREKFFLNNVKEEMRFVIETIKKQLEYTTFNQKMYEEKVYVQKSGKLKVTFMGVIDKVLYKEEDNVTYVAIIDYKTGDPSISINNLDYGFNMQLPIYLYLSSNMNLDNIKIVGFYLQKILMTRIDNKKDFLKAKEDNLKLEGYSIDNEQILSKFDTTYENSKLIRSMKKTEKGFYHYSKVLTEDEICAIIDKVSNLIDNSVSEIEEANFTIDPKVLNGNNVSCEYCEYMDICYKRNKDLTYISTKKEKEDGEEQ